VPAAALGRAHDRVQPLSRSGVTSGDRAAAPGRARGSAEPAGCAGEAEGTCSL